MNRLYRALHTPPARLARELMGEKELCTAALRPRPADDTLPAMGSAPFVPLPFTPGVQYADPLLYTRGGADWLFCGQLDGNAGHGAVAVFAVGADGVPGAPQTVLTEPFGLAFPTVFDWNGETWMLPGTGADHSLILYRCVRFPDAWERAARFAAGTELCNAVVLGQTPDAVTLLCSEVRPGSEVYTRWRRRVLRRGEDGFALTADDAFDLRWRDYALGSRNAGPLFDHGGQTVHPAQVSTRAERGVWLQFYACKNDRETPMCAVGPRAVTVRGIAGRDIIGIQTYSRTPRWEALGLRVLGRTHAKED